MPRTGKPDHERVLSYFETAHPAEARIVLAMAKTTVARREADQALVVSTTQTPSKPKAKGKPGPKPKAAGVIAMRPASAPAQPRRKPGPKPGSKRKPHTAPLDIVDGSDPAPAEDFNLVTDDEIERELAGV